MMEYFNLRPISVVSKLKRLEKKDRVVAIGKMMRSDPSFSKNLENSFNKIVNIFIETNNLKESDIVSIKRDAVFVKNKGTLITSFGTSVKFIPKNTYVGFIKIKNMEFWIKENHEIDVKGINDDNIKFHKNGILYIINYLYDICSKHSMDKVKINKSFSELITAYKNKELENDCYREFNSESKYRIRFHGKEILMDNLSESFEKYVDISYNYINILIPLIQLFC